MNYQYDSWLTHDPRADLYTVRVWDEYNDTMYEDHQMTLSEVDALVSKNVRLELMEETGIPQYDLLG